MSDERRTLERYPSFSNVEIVVRDSKATDRSISVMLRDESPLGLGGVYVGNDLPDIGDRYYLKNGETSQELHLAWWEKVADSVLLIGFEIPDEH